MTLVETMIAIGLASLVVAAVVSFSSSTAWSFAAMGNYADLDRRSRNALDRMSRDIRQADCLSTNSANSLVFRTTDPTNGVHYTITYTYDSGAQTLTRTLGGESGVLLTNCTYYHHSIFQRNPTNGVYGQYPLDTATGTNQAYLAKVIQLTWICSRTVLGRTNSEGIQSARIVIRKD